MIRVLLPYHLRILASVGDEVQLAVEGPVTQRTGVGRAGSAISDAARDDSGAWNTAAAGVLTVLCMRGRFVA